MRRLPLYDLPALSALEQAEPLDLNPGCKSCKLGEREGLKSVCIGADGSQFIGPGGLLVVGEGPGAEEDRQGRPFIGQSGTYLRRMVAKWWKGSVVYDNATRCAPPRAAKDTLLEKATDACRGFLRQTLDEVKPSRVLALGAWSAYSILGRSVAPYSARGGFGWLWSGGEPVPVYTLIHPAAALRNRFVRGWYEADLEAALTAPLPSPPPWGEQARVVMGHAGAVEAARELRSARWVSFDFETFGKLYTDGFRVLSVSLCAAGSSSPWVWGWEALADEATADELRALLCNPAVRKVAQNGKFDGQASLRGLGAPVRGLHLDTRLSRHILEPEVDAKLASQAILVGMGGHKEENDRYKDYARRAIRAWAPRMKKDGTAPEAKYDSPHEALARLVELHPEDFTADPASCLAKPSWFTDSVRQLASRMDADELDAWSFSLVPRQVLYRYNGLDAVTTAMLGDLLETRLCEAAEPARVWNTIVRPASTAVEQVESWGLSLNSEAIEAFGTYLRLRISDVRSKLAVYGTFDPDSPPQLRELLFKQLGLAVMSETETGLESTDKDALNLLKGQHPIVDHLLEYRHYTKLRTSAEGWRRYVQSDGRIHTSLNIDGARSGRLSSSEPNLQNVDRASTSEGKLARDCFVPAPGWQFVEADYSQLELRVAALLSGDPAMLALFAAGEDFHQKTAEFIAPIVWKIKAGDVTQEHRSRAKTFVFGVLYGMTDGGIVARTGCTKPEAQAIRQAIMGRFTKLDRWIKERIRSAQREGGCWTWWDGAPFRFRPLWRLGDSDQDSGPVIQAKNGAFNSPVQGTANEFCLASLIRLVEWVKESRFPARVVLTVHDSILCETAPGNVPELAAKMEEVMTGWNSGGVPLKVDFKTGFAWGSMAKYKIDEKVAPSGQG